MFIFKNSFHDFFVTDIVDEVSKKDLSGNPMLDEVKRE